MSTGGAEDTWSTQINMMFSPVFQIAEISVERRKLEKLLVKNINASCGKC